MRKSRPQPIAEILSELMSRRGYARQRASQKWDEVWREAVGPLAAEQTRVGSIRRGVLEVIVAHSTLMQELTFQKQALVAKLRDELPEEPIADIRLRVGPVE